MTTLTNKLKDESERNEEPILNLIPSSYDTAVKTPTQESYNELMRIYEIGKWKWRGTENLPTEFNLWNKHKEETCITPEIEFGYADINFVCRENYRVISIQKFYEEQEITPSMIKKINDYFEKLK